MVRCNGKPTVDVIRSYAAFRGGWDFGTGEAFTEEVINEAVNITLQGEAHGFFTESFPEVTGAITVAFINDSHCLDISINPNLSYDIQYEVGIGQDYTVLVELDGVQKLELENWFLKLKFKN